MNSQSNNRRAGLVGEWTSVDPFGSSVVYLIENREPDLGVSAIDLNDNEEAEIYNVEWKEEKMTLTFSAHWRSSGRLSKCELMEIEKGKLRFTYTYTDTDILIKSGRGDPTDSIPGSAPC